MKKFINLSILFIFLILAVSCKKENFSKKDFAGYWENFSTEKLKSFAQKNQTDGGDFSIKKSFLILEPYYQIQNDEIQDFEKIIPIKLNFEFSQDKKELTLTFADNQKIILKKIESNNLN